MKDQSDSIVYQVQSGFDSQQLIWFPENWHE